MKKDRWWSGFAAGITLGLLIYSGASLLLVSAAVDDDLFDHEYTFEVTKPETVTCVCDWGHEWEATGCGISFDFFGTSFGPYCQVHMAEFMDANFPPARELEE